MKKRLVCVTEGHGDVRALPRLCVAVLQKFERWNWQVLDVASRIPRSQVVDGRVQDAQRRPPRSEGMTKIIADARARGADALLLLVDQDDDCPAVWAPPATDLIRARVSGAAVMAVREYESWFLHQYEVPGAEQVRDAKGEMCRVIPGYKPTRHQFELTRKLDIDRVRTKSKSFDKLVRTIDVICPREDL